MSNVLKPFFVSLGIKIIHPHSVLGPIYRNKNVPPNSKIGFKKDSPFIVHISFLHLKISNAELTRIIFYGPKVLSAIYFRAKLIIATTDGRVITCFRFNSITWL